MGIHINKLVSALVFMLLHCIFFFQVNPENIQKASTSRQLKNRPVPFGCVCAFVQLTIKKGFFFLPFSKFFFPEC